ncbi:hypothetical protein FAGAP_8107 [Fusarium agapanthi]|uniref:Uncharacterized protein n=1 Tax=Fusarium agapanthi TaxID=1803897 RepID=A0A9P5B4P1_9HYPO|nr:hypothetical protein FAGAP_8107 [Fusarium agapanthi]
MQLNWVFLLVASLASLAACRRAKFLKPPPWGSLNDGILQEFDDNKRYKHGEFVDVRISDGPILDLSVWQLNTVNNKRGKEGLLEMTKMGGYYVWRAKYDIGHYLKNGEDAVYWFEMRGGEIFGSKYTTRSTYINVSMPDSFKSQPPAPSKTTSLVRVSSTTQPSAESTATEEPSREEEKASTRSGLTGPQVAGIAIGASVAFILMLAGFCWGFERMRVARQLQKSHEFELRNMERDVRALRETVSKLGA